jgi:predicted Zn-dependent protease
MLFPSELIAIRRLLQVISRCVAFGALTLVSLPTFCQQGSTSKVDVKSVPVHQTATTQYAQQLIAEGKLKEALAELEALAAQQPQVTGVDHLRGFVYYQQSDLKQAEIALTRALAQDPYDEESRQMLGVVLYRLDRPSDAIPILEEEHSSIAMASVDPNYLLSLCYMDVQRYDDARRTIAAEYGFPAASPSAYLLAGQLLLRREYTVPAEAAARKALALNPRLPLAHELLGAIDLAKSDIAQATAEFKLERAVNPLDGGVYEHLGDAYFRAGNYELARRALDRAILLDPNSTGPYILLGKVLMKQQNSVMATRYLQRALHMDSGNYITHLLLGQAYHSTGRVLEASQEFKIAERMRFGTPAESQEKR